MQILLDNLWQLGCFLTVILALIIAERILRTKGKLAWLRICCCVAAVLGALGLFVFLIYIEASLELILAFMLALALAAVV